MAGIGDSNDTLGSMFPPISGPDMANSIQVQPQQTMQSALPAAPTGDSFETMAARMGLDTSNLHKSPDVAKLQLMNQMQQRIGPGFMTHPQFGPLMQAFEQKTQMQPAADSNRANAMTSQANRTLGALAKLNGGNLGS